MKEPMIIDEEPYFARTGRLFPPGVTSEADLPEVEDSDVFEVLRAVNVYMRGTFGDPEWTVYYDLSTTSGWMAGKCTLQRETGRWIACTPEMKFRQFKNPSKAVDWLMRRAMDTQRKRNH